jgi:hypothetical protein
MRNTIMTVLCVPAQVAVQTVSHVDELLGNNNFQRSWPRLIDARKIDQNEMISGSRHERVGAADRRPYPPSEPALKDTPLRRHPQMIDGQLQARQIQIEKLLRFRVIDLPALDGDLQRPQ